MSQKLWSRLSLLWTDRVIPNFHGANVEKIFQTIQTDVWMPFILKLCSKNLGAGQNKAYPIEIRTLEDTLIIVYSGWNTDYIPWSSADGSLSVNYTNVSDLHTLSNDMVVDGNEVWNEVTSFGTRIKVSLSLVFIFY